MCTFCYPLFRLITTSSGVITDHYRYLAVWVIWEIIRMLLTIETYCVAFLLVFPFLLHSHAVLWTVRWYRYFFWTYKKLNLNDELKMKGSLRIVNNFFSIHSNIRNKNTSSQTNEWESSKMFHGIIYKYQFTIQICNLLTKGKDKDEILPRKWELKFSLLLAG